MGPISVQLTPSSVEYCQKPFALLLSSAVIAIPCKGPSASVIVLPIISSIVLPGLEALLTSSGISVNLGSPLLSRMGASLTGVTLILIVFVSVKGPSAPVCP